MKIGKYTIDRKSIINVINKAIFGINSNKYWEKRFKRNWISSGGRVQTAVFAASFCLQDFEISPTSIIDYGCGAGDSSPFLKMRFPKAELYLYDFSETARKLCSVYDKQAKVLNDSNNLGVYDLLYCSNVVEHIENLEPFLLKLSKLSSQYIVIQAPYMEFHDDGKKINPNSPKGEHVWTIDDGFFEILPKSFLWQKKVFNAPFAWEKGQQVIFFGKKI